MTTETPSQTETLRELDKEAQQLPRSDPLAPRPKRTPPTGRKHPDTGAGLLPDEDSFSEATSSFRPAKSRATRSTAPAPARPASLPSPEEVEESTNALAGLLLLAGGLAAQVMPVTGMTMVKRSEMASKAILDIAKTNPAVWRYLKWLAAMSKYEELGQFTASMVVAVGVDTKVMNPNGMFPQQLIPDVLAMFAAPAEPEPSQSPNGHAEPVYASSIGGSDG